MSKQLAFPVEEYHNRLDKIKKEMANREIEVLLVNTPENICYLTGHHSQGYYISMCLLVPLNGEVILLLRRGELGNAKTESWLDDHQLVGYDDTDNPIDKTAELLCKQGIERGRVGVECSSWFLTVVNYMRLKEQLPASMSLIDASGIVEQARAIKSPREISYVKKACKAASQAMQRGIDVVSEGANDNEIAAAMFTGLCLSGSEYLGMEPFVASGPRSGTMHTTWAGRTIEKGDSVILEVAGTCKRYHGALMRTVYVDDSLPSEVRKWSDVAIEALNEAINAIRPGVTTGQVDEACRSVIEKAGLYENFRKRTGYSIGIAFAPDWGEGHIISLKQDGDQVLLPGMVFHIPPAIREYGQFGVGFSETVVVTEDGCEVLTKLDRELVVK